LGGDPGPGGVITSGRGWDFLHGHMSDTPLQNGDVLHLELIPRFDGYASRMMRCVVIGDISPEMEALSRKMIELQDKQIAAMKPGAKAKDVDRILRQGALDAKLREQYTNITGYTLGYYSDFLIRGSDFTWVFLPNSEWILEEGMVFHMYASAGGIAISETVLVGPNGGELLTATGRKLFSSSSN
jgi:Xaa-Pro dipeptidase